VVDTFDTRIGACRIVYLAWSDTGCELARRWLFRDELGQLDDSDSSL
jgi:hypothetical protein